MQRAVGHVINAEGVIRDPPPYRDVLLMLATATILFLANPHDMSLRVRVWIFGPMLSLILGERLLSRGWVHVGPSGVRFGRWLRKTQYNWGAVESFVVGNPGLPEIAYVIVKPSAYFPSTSLGTRAVRLPKLFSVPPSELVAELERRRRILGEGLRGARF